MNDELSMNLVLDMKMKMITKWVPWDVICYESILQMK